MSDAKDDASSLYAGLVEDLGEPSLAARVIDSLRARFGGTRIYLQASETAVRDAEIRRRFTGRNRIELCHEFRVSKTTLYRIVGRKGP